jgi:hypothetical protein
MTRESLTFRTFGEAVAQEIEDRGPGTVITRGSCWYDYFPSPAEGHLAAKGFLVRLGPQSQSGAHSHPVDQFQVLFGPCDGWYQRSDLTDVMVLYADANTTYGPFGSRTDELWFFSLRSQWSNETHYPGAKADVPRGRVHRNRRYHLPPQRLREEAMAVPAKSGAHLLGAESDGTAVWLVTAGPQASFEVPHGVGGAMYVVLLSGAMMIEEVMYGARDVCWVPPDCLIEHSARTLDVGLQALFLQFRSSST